MHIRKYTKADCDMITQLFYSTVHNTCSRDYTKEQLDAWAAAIPNAAKWNEEFLNNYTIVAEHEDNIVGFGDIDGDYIDRLYVHQGFQKLGIGAKIVAELEKYAISNGVNRLTVHASITAKGFFENLGYTVQSPQQVVRHGVALANYIMVKNL